MLNHTIRRLLLCAPALLGACAGDGGTTADGRPYGNPIDISSAEADAQLPPQIDAYMRGIVYGYPPDFSKISVRYESTASLKQALSLDYSPRQTTLPGAMRAAQTAILQGHAEAKVISERRTRLSKDGARYPAAITLLTYKGALMGRNQPLAASIIIVELPDHFLRIKSIAPEHQSEAAQKRMLDFMQKVAWSFTPPAALPQAPAPEAAPALSEPATESMPAPASEAMPEAVPDPAPAPEPPPPATESPAPEPVPTAPP